MKKDTIYHDIIKPYITGNISSCSYCDKIKPLILYYGQYFYITVAIGAYMPGYVQLCSYRHRTSATGILPTEYDEFNTLSIAIRNCFKRIYGNYGISFEHGQAGTCLWDENHINSLCHHMHVHYLPSVIDIHVNIISKFSDYIEVSDVYDMVKIRQDVLHGGPYLFFSPSPRKGYMYNVKGLDVPRQYLRKCVADKLELSEKADWQKYPGDEYYEQTIMDLSGQIERELEK